MFSIPKNTGVHAKFKSICMIKNVKGKIFFLLIPSRKKKNKETAIIIYKIVHTGAKSQSGGLKGGLSKL